MDLEITESILKNNSGRIKEECQKMREKAQGYYFGKPMPMEETKAFTKAKGLEWEETN
ncbi:hypothetical protein SAMN02910369_01026 [Lachnospiraceae bacterium NE2001]|nr:hypothetical protein SAMN02910369_01026 [Lachnospiraceae bacterium NE2001]